MLWGPSSWHGVTTLGIGTSSLPTWVIHHNCYDISGGASSSISLSWFPLLWWLSGKESTCSTGDPCSISGSGRSPGEGNGNPLQYSCLENSVDGGAWWTIAYGVAKSRTRPNDWRLLPFPTPGDRLNPGIEPRSALQADSLPLAPPRNSRCLMTEQHSNETSNCFPTKRKSGKFRHCKSFLF